MRRLLNEKNIINNNAYNMFLFPTSCTCRAVLAYRKNKLLVGIKKEKGFITLQLLVIMLVIILTTASLMMGVAFAAKKNATATYMWFGEAMEYASQAANMQVTNVVLHTPIAHRFFTIEFSQMTNTYFNGTSFVPQTNSPFTGPITLNRFTAVQPGDTVPGGTAKQPGYVAEITVPVLSVELPFIGHKEVFVPMKYYAVVKNTYI